MGVRLGRSGQEYRKAQGQHAVVPCRQEDQQTLIPLIKKYVAKDSTILSDVFATYQNLNDLGPDFCYKHFTVSHKHNYMQIYINTLTGQEITINTNTIEICWVYAKNHFRRIFGCHATTFQGHLCDLMWRWWNKKGNLTEVFMNKVTELYNLEQENAQYRITYPYFTDAGCYCPPAHESIDILHDIAASEQPEQEDYDELSSL